MGFNSSPSFVQDGVSRVDAADTNAPLIALLNNDLWLAAQIAALQSQIGTAMVRYNVTVASGVQVGQPVFYNPSTNRYELAIADGSNNENVIGVVRLLHSATLADLTMLGYDTINLTAALNGAGLASGRYYLSGSVAGTITTTPQSHNVLVLISDGQSNVYVLPQVADTPVSPSTNNPQIQNPIIVPYTAFQAGNPTTVMTLAAKQIVRSIFVELATPLTGGGATAVTLELLHNGSSSYSYIPGPGGDLTLPGTADVKSPSAGTLVVSINPVGQPQQPFSLLTTSTLQAKINVAGGTVGGLTAGSLTIWVEVATLP